MLDAQLTVIRGVSTNSLRFTRPVAKVVGCVVCVELSCSGHLISAISIVSSAVGLILILDVSAIIFAVGFNGVSALLYPHCTLA